MCTHMMRYVEVCELQAKAQDTYNIMKQLAIFCDKRNEYGGSSTISRREALKFSSQLPASFLEELVPVGMHSLQA